MSDLVNHPSHYEEQSIKLEPIDFCERLPFCEGNALKYCFRAGHKEGASELLDLKKAQWYLNRWRCNSRNLSIPEEKYQEFKDLTVYLMRAGGVLGAASYHFQECSHRDICDFWIFLDEEIEKRIKFLENRRAV